MMLYLIIQDMRAVHIRFIDECFHRLEDLTNSDGPARTGTGYITDQELRLQAMERLLLLAQRYISTVEVWKKDCEDILHIES